MVTRRQSVLEMFSSFLQLNDTRSGNWITDPRLKRSMLKCLAAEAEGNEHYWVVYWHRQWGEQTKPIVQGHLYAYLQEPALWAAEQILRKMVTPEPLVDCFQFANTGMAVVLKGFKPEKGYKFKSFAGTVFLNLLREWLRKQNEAASCTTWGLLRKIGKTKLAEALERENLAVEQRQALLLAQKCFKELYVPQQVGRTDRLPEPDAALWEAVADLYNQERLAAAVGGEAVTGKVMQQWMLKLEAIIRRYLSPRVDSLDPFPGGEDGATIDVPDTELTPVDQAIAREMAQEYQDLLTQQHEVLVAALQQLGPEDRQMIQLWFQEGMGQTAIARHLNEQQIKISQATVSRRIDKAQQHLLDALLDWRKKLRESEGEVNKALTLDQVKDASLALEVWLENRYPENTLNAEQE